MVWSICEVCGSGDGVVCGGFQAGSIGVVLPFGWNICFGHDIFGDYLKEHWNSTRFDQIKLELQSAMTFQRSLC